MFFAEKGSGAYLNNSRIRVSNKKKIREAVLVTGGPHYGSKNREDIFNEYIKISNIVDAPIRKFGSAALDIANVACGRFDGYWQREVSYWDVAAGIVILREAGGYVEFMNTIEKNSLKRNIIATNSKIHQELQQSLLKKNIE
jgi:myo-inositol-1(or 4)-monophosphatase